MATTIRSTELDFFEIKENLKLFLKQSDEFRDYDFEGSALSNILDVLSHNTHFNALLANFALNESYLTTAQLRNSVVSLAESLGYIPSSATSSQCTTELTINLNGVKDLESQYHLLPGELVLRGSNDDLDYVFTNRETLVATSNGSGVYSVAPFADPDAVVRVFEGEHRVEQYVVDGSNNAIYVIPDEDIDISSAIVKLYEDRGVSNTGLGAYQVYNSVFSAKTIDESSKLYILRESPNRYYELTFGDNNSLGRTPKAGNVVEIDYLRTSGKASNGVATLRLARPIIFGERQIGVDNINIVTLTRASGGDEREEIESIRKRAPFQYAAQNRMVTPLDYEALILRSYSNYIQDIVCWGGEEDYRRDYGTVYVSIVWQENLSSITIGEIRDKIRELSKNFSIVSFAIKFVAPSETYISTNLYYQYNPTLSANSESTINSRVRNTVDDYFSSSVGKFQQVFRRSNLLTRVDDTDPSILSSRVDVLMQKRIIPILTIRDSYILDYPVPLKNATDSEVPVIKTSPFNHEGKTVYIRNKLNDRVKVSPEGRVPIIFDRLPSTKLELVDFDDNVIVTNIGYYEPQLGRVHITGLSVQNTMNANNYIKIFAIPANQSVIESAFQNILNFDDTESNVRAVPIESKV
jgi:hypothetical protein